MKIWNLNSVSLLCYCFANKIQEGRSDFLSANACECL